MINPFKIIIRPVVTEKTYGQAHGTAWKSRKPEEAASIRWYAFEVHPTANKHQIREAIEKLFEVKVVAVHTMHVSPRTRRVRTRAGLTKAWKKALVRISAQSKAIEGF
jgi:large subunit ribosomal protein L23